jgi:hypothetical protein
MYPQLRVFAGKYAVCTVQRAEVRDWTLSAQTCGSEVSGEW